MKENELLEDFVQAHLHENVSDLCLCYGGKELGFDLNDAVAQIASRSKTRTKLPWFNANASFRYPCELAAEQATNQNVALFHGAFISAGDNVADITAGLGIDAFTFALRGANVTAIELDSQRAGCLRHNAEVLHAGNMEIIHGDAMDILQSSEHLPFNWLFADPARRDARRQRVFLLSDCLPDVTVHEDFLLRSARNVLVKASPLLDISGILRELRNVHAIHIVSFKGEVKETLIHLTRETSGNPEIQVIDLADANDAYPNGPLKANYSFSTDIATIKECEPHAIQYADIESIKPGGYIYELGAGMRKFQSPKLIQRYFPDLKSFHRESGLFVSDAYHASFPGRIERIERVLESSIDKELGGQRLRVVSASHPLSAERLRKKYKIKEGEARTLYATTLHSKKTIYIIASK